MKRLFIITFIFLIVFNSESQRKRNSSNNTSVDKSDISISALRLRNVGPAFLSGRIADIAIHPNNDNVWYVATGSSGVWKTENSGTTYTPIFDNETTYSTGCVTIDPSDPSIIWLGTGENVGGRHVAFGDGVFKSENGGKSWKNMGLRKSEHISEIIVHPNNSNIIWAASQGPLWSPGGERGLYKSTDGGENWTKQSNAVAGATGPHYYQELYVSPHHFDRLYLMDANMQISDDGGKTFYRFSSFLTHLFITPHPYVFGTGVALFDNSGSLPNSFTR